MSLPVFVSLGVIAIWMQRQVSLASVNTDGAQFVFLFAVFKQGPIDIFSHNNHILESNWEHFSETYAEIMADCIYDH